MFQRNHSDQDTYIQEEVRNAARTLLDDVMAQRDDQLATTGKILG